MQPLMADCFVFHTTENPKGTNSKGDVVLMQRDEEGAFMLR